MTPWLHAPLQVTWYSNLSGFFTATLHTSALRSYIDKDAKRVPMRESKAYEAHRQMHRETLHTSSLRTVTAADLSSLQPTKFAPMMVELRNETALELE